MSDQPIIDTERRIAMLKQCIAVAERLVKPVMHLVPRSRLLVTLYQSLALEQELLATLEKHRCFESYLARIRGETA